MVGTFTRLAGDLVRSVAWLALAVWSTASAQPNTRVDLSGYWVNQYGSLTKISQNGAQIRAVMVTIDTEGRDVFGFAPGDEEFQGVLDRRSVLGKKYLHMPLRVRALCGRDWELWDDIELTMSANADTLQGRWRRARRSDRDCTLDGHVDWPAARYVRTQPARLSVVAVGEALVSRQVELILDASGSMRESKKRIAGRLKIDIAKDVVTQVVGSLPADAYVALRVFGRRIREGQAGDCEDSELLFPFARIDKQRLVEAVSKVQALGTTPIAYSLRQVESDFGNTVTEKTVILVTDGREECGGSPSEVVGQMLAKGFLMRLNIVGVAIDEAAIKNESDQLARLSGGRFFDAKDAAGLRRAISESLALPYKVFSSAGVEVASGFAGGVALELPPGLYSVAVRIGDDTTRVTGVQLNEHSKTRIELHNVGNQVKSRVVRQ